MLSQNIRSLNVHIDYFSFSLKGLEGFNAGFSAPDWFSGEILAGNSGWQIMSFLLSLFLVWAATRILKALLFNLAQKSDDQEGIRPVFLRSVGQALPLLGLWGGIRVGILFVNLGEADGTVERIILTSLDIMFTLCISMFVYFLIDVPDQLLRLKTSNTESKFDDMLVPIVRKSLRVTVFLFALVSIAQILSDKPVSALIAGLGLGGLAFALAAQDTIKNLFGSLVIFTDKPFALGDRINYDGHDGTIEEVGLRSTRLRRLDGHLVTVPNGELVNHSIHNISKRPFIRRIFIISVTYDTPPQKIMEAKSILENILNNHQGLDPKGELLPRVYLSDLSASSLDFKCMYWYHPPAYWDFMEMSEKVNLQILSRFNEAKIEFAFPTQKVHLVNIDHVDESKS